MQKHFIYKKKSSIFTKGKNDHPSDAIRTRNLNTETGFSIGERHPNWSTESLMYLRYRHCAFKVMKLVKEWGVDD
jgi:hypothetical protein